MPGVLYETYNSLTDLMRFFKVSDMLEFHEFWISLSEDEQLYYRTTKLQ